MKEPLHVLEALGVGAERLNALLPGFDPRDVQPGTATIFLFAPPPGGGGFPGIVALLPVAADAPLAQLLRARLPGLSVAPVGAHSMWSPDAALLNERIKQAGALLELASTPAPDDVSVQLNVTSLMANYRQPLRDLVDRAHAVAAMSKQGADSMKVVQALLDSLEDVQAARLGARILPDAFLFSFVSRDKAAPARALEEVDISPDLVRFLPPGHFRMQAAGGLQEKDLPLVRTFLESIYGNDPEVVARMNARMAEQARLTQDMQAALSLSVSPEKSFHFVSLVRTRNAEALQKLDGGRAAMVGESSTQARQGGAGVVCTSSVRHGAWSVEGFPVENVRLDCKPSAGSGAAVRASTAELKIASKFFPMNTDSVRIGDFLVTDVNGSEQELQQIVHELLAGTPRGRPLRATEAFPERGWFHADVDFAGMIAAIDALIPADSSKPRLPALDPALPPVMVTAYQSGAVTEYRGRISSATLAALGQVMSQLQPQAKPPHPKR